jgi:hypothetical protein
MEIKIGTEQGGNLIVNLAFSETTQGKSGP